jgi:hypothetical protein
LGSYYVLLEPDIYKFTDDWNGELVYQKKCIDAYFNKVKSIYKNLNDVTSIDNDFFNLDFAHKIYTGKLKVTHLGTIVTLFSIKDPS